MNALDINKYEKPKWEYKILGYPIGETLHPNNPVNWNILVTGGKKIKRDLCSSGERNTKRSKAKKWFSEKDK